MLILLTFPSERNVTSAYFKRFPVSSDGHLLPKKPVNHNLKLEVIKLITSPMAQAYIYSDIENDI
ncbi:hypothetical protein [Citrobacter freundii complex sp. CFNIH2]|uniref:hypothetical protein n=1 Tax=Citrobacter freundii complex sp. CFNIH2 TaxID=2066049 RepID=UPI001651F870|nr:hypothetical protein [Citrobacter freundii complex sp. CFNIH2]